MKASGPVTRLIADPPAEAAGLSEQKCSDKRLKGAEQNRLLLRVKSLTILREEGIYAMLLLRGEQTRIFHLLRGGGLRDFHLQKVVGPVEVIK